MSCLIYIYIYKYKDFPITFLILTNFVPNMQNNPVIIKIEWKIFSSENFGPI